MYLKRLLAFLCCFTLVFCLFPSSAFASGGNGNIDGGGGSMGQGTSSNFWNSGNDGVRITVVDASSGTAVSSPLDFSNRTQKTSLLHFGKVNKLQYLGGTGLSLQSGVAYSCIRPTQSMPTIVSSKGQSNIEAIKRYFCSEYACMMVAQAAGVDYERMIAGEYKLLIEPIAYFTHNGQYYCMTATEAGLYDQMSGGNLRKTMTSLTHKNLPLSMFLEFSDLGISVWTGNTTGKQNNSDIISTLGVGIVWFDEAPPEGEIEAPDVEYRVDTDVITAVTLRTDQDLTPDNPASVTFHILGTTYRVNDIVITAGDSQVVWVKWHTPSTPQTITITVSVSGAYTAQDTFVAKIVDLNEHIPPDPVATDTNPGYSVPPLPNETQKLTANWGVWSCYWVPVWVWCDHGEDGGELASVEDAKTFVAAGVDKLACGIGNIHGVYPEGWKGLNFDRLKEIAEAVPGEPLVLHGGSGIPQDQIEKAIKLGIAKININTEFQLAFQAATRKYIEDKMDLDKGNKGYDPRKLLRAGTDAITDSMKEMISWMGTAPIDSKESSVKFDQASLNEE